MKKSPPLFLNIFKFLFTLGIALCVFASCSNLGGFEEKPDSTLTEGALLQRGEGEGILNGSIFSESDCARTAMPGVPTISSYQVTATNGVEVVTVPNSEIAANGNKFAILLSYGTWRVTANAENFLGKAIFTQTKTVTLNESAPIVDLDFNLSYSQDVALGPGKIDLIINYDTTSGIANIDYSFYKGSSSVYKFFEASGGIFNISHTVTTLGAYSLVINFYDSAGAVLYRIDQIVNTYANLTTDKFEGSAEYIDAGGNITVTKDIIDKFRLSAFYVGGTGIGGKPASDTNSGSQFAPLKTLTRAVQMVNTSPLTPVDGFKIFVQGNTNEIFTPGGFGNIELDSGKTLAIKGTERGNTVGVGGNFVSNGDLSIDNLTFSGAEITAKAGTVLEISNTTLRSHKGGWGAGAIKIESGAVATLEGCSIEDNEVLFDPSNPSDGGLGGAILCYGELTVTSCEIKNNKAAGDGGAAYVGDGGELTVSDCTFSGNTATGSGGTIYIADNGEVELFRCTIERSAATGDGGGIYVSSVGMLQMTGVTFKNNKATGVASKGGGVCNDGGAVHFNEVTFNSENNAAFGKSVWTSNDIDIQGDTQIDGDFYLAIKSGASEVAKIMLDGTLDGTGKIATITVPDDQYLTTTTVLAKTVTGSATLVADNHTRFAVTDQVSGSNTIKWAVGNTGKLELNTKLATVYLKGTGGSDTNLGDTEDTAVATLAVALSRLDTTATNPTIIVASPYVLASGEEGLLNRASATGNKITIERGTATGSVMTISSGTVTIANITFDGKKTVYTSSSGRLLNISGGAVTLGEGAVLQNNANNPSGGNGGAVYNSGTLIINGATAKIIGNEAGFGAAISNYGKVEMSAGTIGGTTSADANKATSNGGGIYNYSSSQGVTITGGSIIGNQAGLGGGICTDKALTITGGTISGNKITGSGKGNGIYYGNGTLEMSGAAQIADNNDVYLATGKFITITGDLTPPDATKPVAVITPPSYTTGTQVLSGTTYIPANKEKFAVTDSSDGTEWGIDDEGKLFIKALAEMYVNSSTGNDDNPGTSAKPLKTLQEAANRIANTSTAATDSYTINAIGTFTAASPSTVVVDFTKVQSGCSVTLKGTSTSSKATINGNNTAQGIVAGVHDTTAAKLNLTLENLKITNCKSSNRGGGVYLYTETTNINIVKNCEITNNTANYGAGLFTKFGTVTFTGNTIENNTASKAGGGIFNRSGTVKLTSGTINGNVANGTSDSIIGGGGIYINEGTFEITGGTITTNTSSKGGGAIYIAAGTVEMTSGEIRENTASSTGGGIHNEGGTVTISGGSVSANQAPWGGGIVNAASGVLNISGEAIIGGETASDGNTSTASGNGGGIYTEGATNISGGKIMYNKSEENVGGIANGGGGVFLGKNTAVVTISGGLISNNSATNGKGVYVSNGVLNLEKAAKLADDIWLVSGKVINITEELTAVAPVAKISIPDASYVVGTQILNLSAIPDADRAAVCDKFTLLNSNGTENTVFTISPTNGKLTRPFESYTLSDMQGVETHMISDPISNDFTQLENKCIVFKTNDGNYGVMRLISTNPSSVSFEYKIGNGIVQTKNSFQVNWGFDLDGGSTTDANKDFGLDGSGPYIFMAYNGAKFYVID